MSSKPENALALVTGAARGIGLAIAERLAKDGFTVLAADLDAVEIEARGRDWAERGLAITGVHLDCTDRAAVAALVARNGPLKVVVNNAAIASDMVPVKDLARSAFERMMQVNLQGTFIVAQEAARTMHPGGRIINIASRGYLGGAGAGHYVASKSGVVGLTRGMAVELRWKGITVNAVAPGMVDTRMLEGFTPKTRQALEAREPSGAAADPSQIASVVSFLASPDAVLLNGQVLLADGGKAAGVPLL
jgi:3-oxoacyl-[acyl-carrier protein] reductase